MAFISDQELLDELSRRKLTPSALGSVTQDLGTRDRPVTRGNEQLEPKGMTQVCVHACMHACTHAHIYAGMYDDSRK